jgi:hypothetical protein
MSRIIFFSLGICLAICGPAGELHRNVPFPAFAPSPHAWPAIFRDGLARPSCASSKFNGRPARLSASQSIRMSVKGGPEDSGIFPEGTASKGRAQPPLSGSGRRIGGLRSSVEDVKKSAGSTASKSWDGRVAANNRKESIIPVDEKKHQDEPKSTKAPAKAAVPQTHTQKPASEHKQPAAKKTTGQAQAQAQEPGTKQNVKQAQSAGQPRGAGFTSQQEKQLFAALGDRLHLTLDDLLSEVVLVCLCSCRNGVSVSAFRCK